MTHYLKISNGVTSDPYKSSCCKFPVVYFYEKYNKIGWQNGKWLSEVGFFVGIVSYSYCY